MFRLQKNKRIRNLFLTLESIDEQLNMVDLVHLLDVEPSWVSRSHLSRSSNWNSRELDAVLEPLIREGVVLVEYRSNPAGGRPSVLYRLHGRRTVSPRSSPPSNAWLDDLAHHDSVQWRIVDLLAAAPGGAMLRRELLEKLAGRVINGRRASRADIVRALERAEQLGRIRIIEGDDARRLLGRGHGGQVPQLIQITDRTPSLERRPRPHDQQNPPLQDNALQRQLRRVRGRKGAASKREPEPKSDVDVESLTIDQRLQVMGDPDMDIITRYRAVPALADLPEVGSGPWLALPAAAREMIARRHYSRGGVPDGFWSEIELQGRVCTR